MVGKGRPGALSIRFEEVDLVTDLPLPLIVAPRWAGVNFFSIFFQVFFGLFMTNKLPERISGHRSIGSRS